MSLDNRRLMIAAVAALAAAGGWIAHGIAYPSAPPARGGDDASSASGCADGTREGFSDQRDIAACAGAFTEPGISTPPLCRAGGARCSAGDLCAPGWHVCRSSGEVSARTNGRGCRDLATNDSAAFFATQQSGPGYAECAAYGRNDIFGCGTIGATPAASCAPLDRFSHDLCSQIGAPWSCGKDGEHEADAVTKPSERGGGVLCCRDST